MVRPIQREKARQQFGLVVALARKAALMNPKTTPPYSALHQPNVAVEHFNAASFDWNTWVEQEKRSRLMHTIFLLDASMVVYFNSPPRSRRSKFESHFLRMMLHGKHVVALSVLKLLDCMAPLSLETETLLEVDEQSSLK